MSKRDEKIEEALRNLLAEAQPFLWIDSFNESPSSRSLSDAAKRARAALALPKGETKPFSWAVLNRFDTVMLHADNEAAARQRCYALNGHPPDSDDQIPYRVVALSILESSSPCHEKAGGLREPQGQQHAPSVIVGGRGEPGVRDGDSSHNIDEAAERDAGRLA